MLSRRNQPPLSAHSRRNGPRTTIHTLPPEVLTAIMVAGQTSFFPHDPQIPRFVLHLTWVCSRWRAVALDCGLLWRDLDFSGPDFDINLGASRLDKAKLTQIWTFLNRAVRFPNILLDFKLEILHMHSMEFACRVYEMMRPHFSRCRSLSFNFVVPPFRGGWLEDLVHCIRKARQLTHLHVKLQHGTPNAAGEVPTVILYDAHSPAPQSLRHFSFMARRYNLVMKGFATTNLKGFGLGTQINIDRRDLYNFLLHNSQTVEQIPQLDLSPLDVANRPSSETYLGKFPKLTNLVLDLQSIHILSTHMSTPALETLTLVNRWQPTGAPRAPLMLPSSTSWPKLHTLSISEFLPDAVLKQISTSSPLLQTLILPNPLNQRPDRTTLNVRPIVIWYLFQISQNPDLFPRLSGIFIPSVMEGRETTLGTAIMGTVQRRPWMTIYFEREALTGSQVPYETVCAAIAQLTTQYRNGLSVQHGANR